MAEKTKTLTLFHGDKGGVGKSFCASVYIDKKLASEAGSVVVEADNRNPDIERIFASHLPTERLDLTDHSGVMDFVDFLAENTAQEVIVSLPAGVGKTLNLESELIKGALDDLGYKLRVFWPINRLPDSIVLLKRFMTETALAEGAEIIVVLNGFFGDEDKFSRWNDSKVRKEFLAAGGSEKYLPALHDRVVDKIVGPFSLANDDLKYSEKAELQRWLKTAHEVCGD